MKVVKKLLPQKVKNIIVDTLGSQSADRQRIVTKFVQKDDSVLDIGCIEHSLDRANWRDPEPGEWLHADLQRISDDVFGIDILNEDIKKLQSEGFNVEVADAEEFKFDRKFDIIIAGELIEHLSNPGEFLDRAREHIHSDGSLIITTPNPRQVEILQWFLLGDEHRVNPEHVAWFDHYVLDTLASRHGFKIRKWHWHKPSIGILTRSIYHLGVGYPLIAGGYVFELKPV